MSSNGNAFHSFTLDAAQFLSGLDALEFYQQPLQSADDMRLYDIVAGLRESGRKERSTFSAGLSDSQKSILALFAHRAATAAVRLNSPAWLENAMLATVIANSDKPDSRSSIDTQLAVFHHCARTLDLSPATLFDWAATYADDPLASHLEAFGRRTDVTLKKYGWSERRTPEGVKFSARWE